MFYWEGPLYSRELIIERRRLSLRSQLLAFDCMTELIPLLQKLPEVGDFGVCLMSDFEQLRKSTFKFLELWVDSEPEEAQAVKNVKDCLNKFSRLKTIQMKTEPVLCTRKELNESFCED